jgi:hypothetical protein
VLRETKQQDVSVDKTCLYIQLVFSEVMKAFKIQGNQGYIFLSILRIFASTYVLDFLFYQAISQNIKKYLLLLVLFYCGSSCQVRDDEAKLCEIQGL